MQESIRKPLVAAFLLLGQAAWAEWQFVGGSERADYYIEMQTIQRDADRRQVLELLDLKAPDSQGNRSYLALTEYECPSMRSRILRSACFDGPMGGGNKTHEQLTPGNWLAPEPGSAGNAKMKLVCDQ